MLVQPSLARLIRPDWALRTPSPLQDTIDPVKRATMVATNPDSWLHVALPDLDVASALARLLEQNAYDVSNVPRYFIYQYSEVGHRQIGLVANIPIEAFVTGRVKVHEHVHTNRVKAIVAHQQALAFRGDLVALLFPDDRALEDALTPVTNSPADVEIPGELHHRIWVVPPEFDLDIAERFEDKSLYLIDGHHRVAAAIEEWAALGKPAGYAVLCLLTPQSQLRSLAFDRRVVGPIVNREWLNKATVVEEPFRRRGEVCIYFDERWWSMPLASESTGVNSLDVIRLHRQLLEPVFGISDHTSPLLEVTSEKVEMELLRHRCDNDGGAAFIIAAPTVAEIVQVADLGQQLPPKSSYFDPKPWSGVFLSSPLSQSGMRPY